MIFSIYDIIKWGLKKYIPFAEYIISASKYIYGLKSLFFGHYMHKFINVLSIITGYNDSKDSGSKVSKSVNLPKSHFRGNILVIIAWICLLSALMAFIFYKTMLRDDDIALLIHIISMCSNIITQATKFEFHI